MGASDREPLLTVKQAAEYLNVSKGTIYRHVADEDFPGIKVGGKVWRFKMADLDRYASRVIVSDAISRGASNELLQAGNS